MRVIMRKIWRYFVLGLVNNFLRGTHFFKLKRALLNSCYGLSVGVGTKIVAPITVYGTMQIGNNCWIGHDFSVEGNGKVFIGDNCDIAPSVFCLTGSHEISSNSDRRAGKGISFNISIGDGCWIGARSTLMGNIIVRSGTVIGACALVTKSTENDSLYAGVPAHKIKNLFDICHG